MALAELTFLSKGTNSYRSHFKRIPLCRVSANTKPFRGINGKFKVLLNVNKARRPMIRALFWIIILVIPLFWPVAIILLVGRFYRYMLGTDKIKEAIQEQNRMMRTKMRLEAKDRKEEQERENEPKV